MLEWQVVHFGEIVFKKQGMLDSDVQSLPRATAATDDEYPINSSSTENTQFKEQALLSAAKRVSFGHRTKIVNPNNSK